MERRDDDLLETLENGTRNLQKISKPMRDREKEFLRTSRNLKILRFSIGFLYGWIRRIDFQSRIV